MKPNYDAEKTHRTIIKPGTSFHKTKHFTLYFLSISFYSKNVKMERNYEGKSATGKSEGNVQMESRQVSKKRKTKFNNKSILLKFK